MRTREEIENGALETFGKILEAPKTTVAALQMQQLEVLLDIRELLAKQ